MKSKFGGLHTWSVKRFIVKVGDDLRVEQFAVQLITLMDHILSKVGLRLSKYEILATGKNQGLVEFVEDALSIDHIRKMMHDTLGQRCDLYDYFRKNYGSPNSRRFLKAQKNFCNSLAAYSLVCYILQIKDRHNANIMIRRDGTLVHIDFGFMLTTAPGQGVSIESSVPFKLTADFVKVLGPLFPRFVRKMAEGLKQLNKDSMQISSMVEMATQTQPYLSCFQKGTDVALTELN